MKYGIRGLVVFGLMMVNFPGRSLPAIASSPPAYVAQSILGECRAARTGTFVYYERNFESGQIRGLQANDRVTLAGNGGGGWIAISEPTVGFVRTEDLKPCTVEKVTRCANVNSFIYESRSLESRPVRGILAGEPLVLTTEQVDEWRTVLEPRPGFIPDNRLRECNNSSSTVVPSRPSTNRPQPTTSLCHRVTPLVDDGLNVRSAPTEAARVVETLVPGTLIRLRSTAARTDSTGRSWVSILSPVSGWVSDGFPGNKSNLRPVPCGSSR